MSLPDLRAFGPLLNDVRRRMDLSLAQVATGCGLTVAEIKMYEAGEVVPGHLEVQLFVNAINPSLNDSHRLYVAAGYLPPGDWVVFDNWLIRADDYPTDGTPTGTRTHYRPAGSSQ